MDQMTLLYVMAAFVVVAAIALCIQAGCLIGVYKTTRRLEDKITPLVPKLDSLVDLTRTTVERSKVQIAEITTKANDILDITIIQLAKVDDVVSDAACRAKVQMDRVEMVLDDTMSRAHEAVATVHNGIMAPVRELSGLAAGIRAAFSHLARAGRPSVAQVTSDEEMFI
ncbi:MAG: hypothetical protein M3O35_00195 [Acidobacteriota bacterium]|jgi:hypothetical protein|nr:hypothetical protein [Acidobacteriota bacterium]